MTYPVLQQCTSEYLYGFLRDAILPIVRSSLEGAEAGQRIRVTTLPGPVMRELCEALQGEDRWVARILVANSVLQPWEAAWSLSNLASMLRLNLFTYRDLTQWIDNPMGTPPLIPPAEQLRLALV